MRVKRSYVAMSYALPLAGCEQAIYRVQDT